MKRLWGFFWILVLIEAVFGIVGIFRVPSAAGNAAVFGLSPGSACPGGRLRWGLLHFGLAPEEKTVGFRGALVRASWRMAGMALRGGLDFFSLAVCARG